MCHNISVLSTKHYTCIKVGKFHQIFSVFFFSFDSVIKLSKLFTEKNGVKLANNQNLTYHFTFNFLLTCTSVVTST